MRDKEYSKWLQSYANTVVGNYIKECHRVEDNLHIDLDDEFVKDNGKSLLAKLTYTTNEQLYTRPRKCKTYFYASPDLCAEMSLSKTAVSKYFEFCQGSTAFETIKNYETKNVYENTTTSAIMDSYQEFLTYFKIDRTLFFEWGISSIIFPPIDKVALKWKELKKRIFNNEEVYIRGYGRDAHGTQLYKNLYAELLNNSNVKKDRTNNDVPHKLIKQMTKLKRNKDIYNYQVSHIWGHTKNIFMFEAPWNICYMPKIMDPFTGHETKGIWPAEYQKMYISKANELYKPFINEYNQLLITLNIETRLQEYLSSLRGSIPEKQFAQFSEDVVRELSPIA